MIYYKKVNKKLEFLQLKKQKESGHSNKLLILNNYLWSGILKTILVRTS